jgi:hypothetical protein
MNYKVNKEDFSLTFTSDIKKKGIILKVSRKKCEEVHYYSLVFSKVFKIYKLINGAWALIDTSTIKHEKSPTFLEKGGFDLIYVMLCYPIEGKYLKLKFDELFFLQAFAYDLENSTRDLEVWLPPGKEFSFIDDKLVSYHEGWEYTCEMPRSLGFTVDDFISQPYKEISKTKELRIPISPLPFSSSKSNLPSLYNHLPVL